MKGTLIEKIAAAIENGELQAYFQPQYNPRKGVIGGAEALVRWVKPDGTIISPAEFIPELEANGQVGIVDWFILEEACKTLQELKDKAVKISVNFGREHAKDAEFIRKLDTILESYGISKNLIGIEITESDVATEKNDVINWVKQLEGAGYTVSIDDFGSGMSSLSFVKDVPAKVLKIDKSFLEDNCESEKGRITLESVFYMAHRLKLITVVEGVETKEQLDFINTCDCDYIQGFIFSEPVSHDTFYKMCTEDAAVEVDYVDPFSSKATFGQVKALVDAVYKKFPLVIFVNLTRNSYHVMRRENFMEHTLPSTGSYDEGYEYAKTLCLEEDYEKIDEAFTRENLINAKHEGKKRVLRILKQRGEDGRIHRVAIEDYFMDNPDNDDVYMVAFFHDVDFTEDTYIGETRKPISDGSGWLCK